MTQFGQHTQREIFSQPAAWETAIAHMEAEAESLRRFFRDGQYESVIFTGCGSTYYLSIAGAALFQQLGVAEARALPASEIWLYPQAAYATSRRTLLIAVSRSGETTETLRAVESFPRAPTGRRPHALLLSTIKRWRAWARSTSSCLPVRKQSVAQTRAFTVLYLGVTALAALWSGRDDLLAALHRLPEVGQRVLDRFAPVAHRHGADAALERFYILGSGTRYGLAAEVSLKLKEMSLSHSEPFHFMEFRHGPQSMVTEKTLIVGLLSDENRAAETAVLDEMRQRGAQVLSIGESDAVVTFESGVPEAIRGALYLPIGQLMAFERAIMRES